MDEVVEDLLINFKSNLLRKDACKLNLSIEVVVSIEVLSKLG